MTPDRRTRIADAAIATLASAGMRGFTHRAVDRVAGLPEGSTSYYFRTREALLLATLDRMAELDTADVGELPAPDGSVRPAELTELLAALVGRWLTDGRERALARYELTLEAVRRPEVRARVTELHAGFLAMTERLLATAGAPEPRRRAEILVASLDGLLFHQLTTRDPARLAPADLRATCHDLLHTALR